MHPISMVIQGLGLAPTAGHTAREAAVQTAQTDAQAAQQSQQISNDLLSIPQQAPPQAPAVQSPIGSSQRGQQSYLSSAATTAPSQQNTATKTLLGQ